MASAWGNSWGVSWGVSWGDLGDIIQVGAGGVFVSPRLKELYDDQEIAKLIVILSMDMFDDDA